MILFNLIFARNILEFSDHLSFKTDSEVKTEAYEYTKKMPVLPCLITNVDFLTNSKDDLADKELISNNLFKKLVNKFWQQTIFLSAPTKLSDKYIAQLDSLNLVGNKVNQKKFLSEFSKSLIDGSIESSLSKERLNDNGSSSIKYVWRKGLNLKYFSSWNSLRSNLNRKSPEKIQKKLAHTLNIKNFPLFVVTNNLGQMVIAEPPELSCASKGNVNLLSSKSNFMPLYQGWFFVSSQDAEEYLQYVKKQYRIATTDSRLRVLACNLETFYKLLYSPKNTIQFRLVPDLHEIGKLVTKYSSYHRIIFNINQNHGKDYFQGQPVYTIMNTNGSSNYYYQISSDKQSMKYTPVFTNYKTALYLWNNSIKNQGHSKISKYPKLMVYNLEDFLEDQSKNSSQNQLPFMLIPSKNSYKFIKDIQSKHNPYIVSENVLNYFSHFKLWIKRVLWSFTSRQFHDW